MLGFAIEGKNLIVQVKDPGIDDDLWFLRHVEDRKACHWLPDRQAWEIRDAEKDLLLLAGVIIETDLEMEKGAFPDDWQS